jgi:hypothetical protein
MYNGNFRIYGILAGKTGLKMQHSMHELYHWLIAEYQPDRYARSWMAAFQALFPKMTLCDVKVLLELELVWFRNDILAHVIRLRSDKLSAYALSILNVKHSS